MIVLQSAHLRTRLSPACIICCEPSHFLKSSLWLLNRMLRSTTTLKAAVTCSAAAGVGAFVLWRRLASRRVARTARGAASSARPLQPASPRSSSTSSGPPAASALLDFLLVVGRLKTTKRTGWIGRASAPESISDHMYRMAILSLVVRDAEVDHTKWFACVSSLACCFFAHSCLRAFLLAQRQNGACARLGGEMLLFSS
jgi:hypothetical protein